MEPPMLPRSRARSPRHTGSNARSAKVRNSSRDRLGPGPDRLLGARLTGVAHRHARFGGLTEDEKTAEAAELREAAGGRSDLLAEVAGIAVGTSESKGPEYVAQGRAMADPCRMAGADEDLIPGWIKEGKRRAEAARQKPGTLRPAP